jgi:hypothetical protein
MKIKIFWQDYESFSLCYLVLLIIHRCFFVIFLYMPLMCFDQIYPLYYSFVSPHYLSHFNGLYYSIFIHAYELFDHNFPFTLSFPPYLHLFTHPNNNFCFTFTSFILSFLFFKYIVCL